MSGRRFTLHDLRLAGACPIGMHCFRQTFGDEVYLTMEHAEAIAPWLHFIFTTLPIETQARLRRAEWRWWLTEAQWHGCDWLDLPAAVATELRQRITRAVLAEVIAR